MKGNPFQKLSELLINNQNSFNQKVSELRRRSRSLSEKLALIYEELESEPFNANLNNLLNLEEEARLLLFVAKEVESQRDKIANSVDLLQKSNIVKLNK